ncbi:MAG: hypothetical protein ACN6OI_08825 [Flavobacterium sp.]|uniref:hypothetical protein n=1 Tax=Flavobacterium sp. TaxID=239 RepID=UPI003D0E1B8E
MSETLANYSFLPWLRQGLSNNIIKFDNDSSVLLRASIKVALEIEAIKVDGKTEDNRILPAKEIQLYGPGDIVGIDSKAIVKTEPRNWITNFEPNYLPYIEFYEEDFPWRYTPARPFENRLRPWLTLVVLKEDEFEDGQNMKDKPLPFFKLKSGKNTADIFPKSSELWAWAHVHVNTDLSNGAVANTANSDTITDAINDLINKNPDNAYSRIICPRKLEPNIGYYAFLIPTFESGRLAGLDYEIPSTLVASKCAWDDSNVSEFPYYHRWHFKTGNMGDFEYLVNLLQPKLADKSIGVRDIDVIHPGSNLPPINDPELHHILKLGGALRVPFDSMKPADKAIAKKYDEWDEHPYPHQFTKAMAARINLSDDYSIAANTMEQVNFDAGIISEDDPTKGDPDPVITSPLYGTWHALQQRLLKTSDSTDLPNNKNWIHELNLDPRFRTAAGIGTKVIQKNQEEYMQAAWEQVGRVTEINNKFRFAQLALQVSLKYYNKHLTPLITEKAFMFTSPVQKRIIYKNLTVYQTISESTIPAVMTSGKFRSITRTRGGFMKKLNFSDTVTPYNLIDRINNGEVVVTPPKTDPEGAINLTDLAEEMAPTDIPQLIVELLKKYKWFKFLPLLLLILLFLFMLLFAASLSGSVVLGLIGAALVWFYLKLKKWNNDVMAATAVTQDSQTPAAVDHYPVSPGFVITLPRSTYTPTTGSTDSEEAIKFKTALKDAFTLISIKFPDPIRKPVDLKDLTTSVVSSLNPVITIPKRTHHSITIPARIATNMVEQFAPVMVYPEIDIPMYKPLSEMSSELFLPNINLIEQNSITLLENNQKFIESYMVGINHEMSRELLWREYPTDQRGSYFRQFWDVQSFLPPQPESETSAQELREKLRDIPKIHEWSKINTAKVFPSQADSPLKNELGQHNQRALISGKTQLVLVIRGELLKKYPTAVIYAHKADWGPDQTIIPDQPAPKPRSVSEERIFAKLSAEEEKNPPQSIIKMPLFEAKVEPDIYFFGFDLDDEEARGKLNPTSITDDPGWFFVIKERPGELRFGLDIEKAKNAAGEEKIVNWNNLSWKDIQTADGSCIEMNKTVTLKTPNADDQENIKHPDDVQARWSPDTNSAELAYILYQVPVLVGVHASRMLPK